MKQAVILIGIPASGKSTFCKEKLFKTHIRVSLDVLSNNPPLTKRIKEDKIMKACIESKQSFVIDNTNLSQYEREKYFKAVKGTRFKVFGYYFSSSLKNAIQRNKKRRGKEKVPANIIEGFFKNRDIPNKKEKFDYLFKVSIRNNKFLIKKM